MKPLVRIDSLFGFGQIYSDNVGLFYFLANYDDGQGNPIFVDTQGFINPTNSLIFDVDYYFSHSGEKYFSPVVMKMVKAICDSESIDYNKFLFGGLDDTEKSTIIAHLFDTMGFGFVIYERFKSKWKHIWDALNTQYNPLENYDMEQTETPDITTEDTEDTTTEIITEQEDVISEKDVYGFNSPSANPSDKVSSSGKTTTTGDGDNNVRHSVKTETGTRGLTRHGNIGVTTSQQMLQSEFEVRKYDFYKMIYNDIDSIMCLKIY